MKVGEKNYEDGQSDESAPEAKGSAIESIPVYLANVPANNQIQLILNARWSSHGIFFRLPKFKPQILKFF